MRAMLPARRGDPLRLIERDTPRPGPRQVLIRVSACGVCRTDLPVVDGEPPRVRYPIISGHEIVGHVEAAGAGASGLRQGQSVRVPWLGHTCGKCRYCLSARENLCDAAEFTGYTLDGGYADCVLANARYAFPLPDVYSDVQGTPLLCARLIGFRCFEWRASPNTSASTFGAAAHSAGRAP